jgi:hypothetical protein
MLMTDAGLYWSQLCGLQLQLRCWIRVVSKFGTATEEGYWGQLLIIPTTGYLEGTSGPIPFRDVEWVDVATCRIKGGIAGVPLQLVDVKDEILAGLRGTSLSRELRDSTWSIGRIFENRSVQVIRIANPVEFRQ